MINRRVVLASGLVTVAATAAFARVPFRLGKASQALLSPPMLDERGETHRLEDFAGKNVLLNIWATWCPPCREEMPALDRLNARLRGPGFMVLPLCIDDAGIGRGRDFYNEIGIKSLPLYWAESIRVQLALSFIGLPTTLLIGRDGKELSRIRGPYDWDDADSTKQLSALP